MSDRETTDNFWEVWNNFQWPEPKPISYRCYYREDGSVDFYTMEDLPGTWIEVSKEIYQMSPSNARVVDGMFKLIIPKKTVAKLQPNQLSGTTCDPHDVCVVVDEHKKNIKWDIKDHELS